MYKSKKSPSELIEYIYNISGMNRTLSPFRDGVLSYLGLEFASFYVEKFGRVKVRTYEYKIIDMFKLKMFDSSLKNV